MEYSFLSQDKFNQIVSDHLRTSKSDRNIVTEETAQQIIQLIENNFEDSTADRNTIRRARSFTIRNINGKKYLYKKISKKHEQIEVRVVQRKKCIKFFAVFIMVTWEKVTEVRTRRGILSTNNTAVSPRT